MSVTCPPLWKYGPVSSTLRNPGDLNAAFTTAASQFEVPPTSAVKPKGSLAVGTLLFNLPNPASTVSENELLNGSSPATAGSSATGRTPVLRKPWSYILQAGAATGLRSVIRSSREFWTLSTLALVVSAAPWQVMHRASAGLPVESLTSMVRVPLGSVGSSATPSKLWKMFR